MLDFRDRRVEELGERLIVASVQDSIDQGRAVETGASRNLQTVTLLDAIQEHRFDAAFGGARRDEERARAKERIFSFRDEHGQWDPRAQRPELWNLYNGAVRQGEHARVFPISNWTELDVWRYIGAEDSSCRRSTTPTSARSSSATACSTRSATASSAPTTSHRHAGRVRYRTVGDMTITGAVRSDATTTDEVIEETLATRVSSVAPPAPTTARARPPWRTASARATSMPDRPPRHRRLGRRRQVDSSAACSYDSKSLMADQVDDAEVDLAATDGLRAEREQGITIDVAYRFFATPRRSFIIADTRATSATRATWSPAPRPPTSPSC